MYLKPGLSADMIDFLGKSPSKLEKSGRWLSTLVGHCTAKRKSTHITKLEYTSNHDVSEAWSICRYDRVSRKT